MISASDIIENFNIAAIQFSVGGDFGLFAQRVVVVGVELASFCKNNRVHGAEESRAIIEACDILDMVLLREANEGAVQAISFVAEETGIYDDNLFRQTRDVLLLANPLDLKPVAKTICLEVAEYIMELDVGCNSGITIPATPIKLRENIEKHTSVVCGL